MTRLALHWQILLTMLVGALLGIVLNASTGTWEIDRPREHRALKVEHIGMSGSLEVPPGRFWSRDTPEVILLQVDDEVSAGDYRSRRIVVGEAGLVQLLKEEGEPWPPLPQQADPAREVPRIVVPTLDELAKKEPIAFALFEQYGRSRARFVGDVAKELGNLFLRMLKMVSIPLIITSLISGITGLGRAERLGKMFGRTVLYYLSTSLIAIFVGLAMVNIIRPGDGDAPGEPAAVAEAVEQSEGQSLTFVLFKQLQNMIPPNPFQALAEGNFLSIIAFSLMFGVCTIWVGGTAAEKISELFDAAFHVMMRLTMVIIELAPIGVFFLMLSATATQGAGVFGTLGWYMLTVACALAIHALLVLPAILHFVAKRDPVQYAKAMSPALLTAFSSASSNGTLPLTLT
ncbi:MAG: dicarboxylate/amino acid:cation symporter, partial [Aeoliella sp.]